VASGVIPEYFSVSLFYVT